MELVLITPLVLLMLLVAVALGRLVEAHLDLASAAQQAARAASLARSAPAAQAAAQQAAADALAAAGRACQAVRVTTDTTALQPGGSVRVTIACDTALSDLGLPLPGTRTGASTATAPVDTYVQETP